MIRPTSIDEFERRRRRLPHWEEPGATYFVTVNLQDRGACDLSTPALAQLVIDALRHFDGSRYHLYDYVVMPDHLHFIIRIPMVEGKSEALWRIMQSLNGWTARGINEVLGRTGQLWQHESHDHIVRNRQDFEEKAQYIFANPLTAGLVDETGEWPWWGRGNGE